MVLLFWPNSIQQTTLFNLTKYIPLTMSETANETDSQFTFWYYATTYFWHTVGVAVVAAALVLFHLRRRWVPKLAGWRHRRNQYLSLINGAATQGSSFQDDIDSGLTSANFDLASNNLSNGDSRKGLDEEGKKQVVLIMNKQGVSFDEARAIYARQKMASHQIGPDGMPLDPKLVTFS